MSNKKDNITNLLSQADELLKSGASLPESASISVSPNTKIVIVKLPNKRLTKQQTDKLTRSITELKECLTWATTQAASWYGFMGCKFNKEGKAAFKKSLAKCRRAIK